MSQEGVSVKDILSLVLLSIIWGTSFILIKKSLLAFDFVELGALRIGISTLAFLPWVIKIWKDVDWSKLKYFFIVGVTGSGLPSFLYAIAETEISSATAGILNGLSPIFTFIIGILFFRTVFAWSKLLGVILGLVGASTLIIAGNNTDVGGNALYGLFIVVATICYAFNANTVKEVFQDTDPIQVAGISFFSVGIPFIIYVLVSDIPNKIINHPDGLISFGAIMVLAIVGTVFSILFFYKLIQDTSAVFASSVAYTIPIVALGWGYLDSEAITMYHFIGLGFILLGVYNLKGK